MVLRYASTMLSRVGNYMELPAFGLQFLPVVDGVGAQFLNFNSLVPPFYTISPPRFARPEPLVFLNLLCNGTKAIHE